MSLAFSVDDLATTYVEVEEAEDTRHVTLNFESLDASYSVELDAEDLARALLTASPAFITAISDTVQRTLIMFIAGVGEAGEDAEASVTNGD